MALKKPLKERKIENISEIEEIINKADICHIALVDGSMPYILPFNFAYENRLIYLHSAQKGKKIDIINSNNNIAINFCTDYELFHRHEKVACSYGMKYKSVLATGKIKSIDEYDEKVRIMNLFMKKYTGKEFSFNSPSIINIKILVVEIDNLTGKKYGY